MRPESFLDHRTLSLNNRIAGWWFTRNRSTWKIFIEKIGRGMALSMRVILRRKIGTETFSFWMVVTGFLWARLCTAMSATGQTGSKPFNHFFDFLAFHDVETSLLNVFSLFFLATCSWYVIKTEFYHPSSNSEPPDVLERGETNLLEKMVDDDKSIFTTESFVQSLIAPFILLFTGAVLLYFGWAKVGGFFLVSNAICLLIDESLYHRAVTRHFRITMANESRLKKLRDKFEKRRQKARSKN